MKTKYFRTSMTFASLYILPSLSVQPYIRTITIGWWKWCWQFSYTKFQPNPTNPYRIDLIARKIFLWCVSLVVWCLLFAASATVWYSFYIWLASLF